MIKKITNFFISGPCVIASMFCATITWLYKPNDLVPIWYVYIMVFISFFVFAILKVYYNDKSIDRSLLIIKAIVIQNNCIYFLTTNSTLLLQDTLITITYNDNDIEKVFGVGYVMCSKNDRGITQIDVWKLSKFGRDLYKQNNHLNALKNNFSIKMSLTKQSFINMEELNERKSN